MREQMRRNGRAREPGAGGRDSCVAGPNTQGRFVQMPASTGHPVGVEHERQDEADHRVQPMNGENPMVH